MSTPGLASVVMPAYNHEQYVEQALRSVIDQTYPHVEIVVVDDGSKDRTAEIAERVLAQGGRPYRILRQANAGVTKAIAAGFAASSGEFVSFLASDDWLFLDKLEKQVRDLQETGADAVYGNIVNWRGPGNEEVYPYPTPFLDHWDPDLFIDRLVTAHGPMLQAGLFRRSILERIGGVDQGFVQEDWPIHIQVAKHARRVRVHAEPCVYYRSHEGNTVRTKKYQLFEWKVAIADRFLTGKLHRHAVASAYHILARATLREEPFRSLAHFTRGFGAPTTRKDTGRFLGHWVRVNVVTPVHLRAYRTKVRLFGTKPIRRRKPK